MGSHTRNTEGNTMPLGTALVVRVRRPNTVDKKVALSLRIQRRTEG